MRQARRAQQLIEYVVAGTLLVMALVSMQMYVRRALQAKIKLGVDAGVRSAQRPLKDMNASMPMMDYMGRADHDPDRIYPQYENYYTKTKTQVTTQAAQAERSTDARSAEGARLTSQSATQNTISQSSKSNFDQTADQYWPGS
jgi:hypothetical protein